MATNPYEPPGSPYEPPKLRPGLTRNQVRTAANLLKMHERQASFWTLLRMSFPRLVMKYVPAFLIVYLVYEFDRIAILSLLGLFTWFAYVEVLHLIAVRRVWSVYEEVIDWEKVQEMAERDPRIPASSFSPDDAPRTSRA